MERSRKQRATGIHPDLYDTDHPFLRWYSSYWRLRDASYVARKETSSGMPSGDIFMGEIASRRFSLGADDDNIPALGIAEDDVPSVMALRWTSAAFLRSVNRRDWVALSCTDARLSSAADAGAVPIRLWLPTSIGLLDGWLGVATPPTSLRIVSVGIVRGKPVPSAGSPLAELPLTFKGDWTAHEKAA